MADVSITAANVLSKNPSGIDNRYNAGATITAGQVVYLEAASKTWKLADTDSATAAVRLAGGIALNGASAGQPLAVHTRGPITIGGTLTANVAYYLSGTAGGICPVGDLTTGDYPCFLGMATSASVLDVAIKQGGGAL